MNRKIIRIAMSAALAAIVAAPRGAAAQDASAIGCWDPALIEGEIPAINIALMPDGKTVVYYSGMEFVGHEERDPIFTEWMFWGAHPHAGSTRVMDLSKMGQEGAVWTPNNPDGDGDLFCSSHVVTANGTLIAVGGTEYGPAGSPGNDTPWDVLRGLRITQRFDNGWVRGSDLSAPRWYPSTLNLADSHILIASGIEVLGNGMTQQDVVERMAPDGTITAIGTMDHKPLYPRLFLIPSGPYEGKVLYTGLGQLWGPMGDFSDPLFAQRTIYDPATGTDTPVGMTLLPSRDVPFCALAPLEPPKYKVQVVCGGGAPYAGPVATNLTEVLELDDEGGVTSWLGEPMHHARWFPLAVHLADGENLLVAGGASDHPNFQAGQTGPARAPVLESELYNFETGAWTVGAAMTIPREYHSTAILLPDGRVMVGGNTTHANASQTLRENVEELDQVINTQFELYSPPYLHRGERPEIVNETAIVFGNYGDPVEVKVKSPSAIRSVHLIKPSAVTHSVDNDHRVVRLEWQTKSMANGVHTLKVKAPARPAVAPPGTYMLFVTRETPQGPVPSVAKMVPVGLPAPEKHRPPQGGGNPSGDDDPRPIAAAGGCSVGFPGGAASGGGAVLALAALLAFRGRRRRR